MSKRPLKRRKTAQSSRVFGAPLDDDSPSAQMNPTTSSSSLSTRSLYFSVPALTTLCARVFVANLGELAQNSRRWNHSKKGLKELPDFMVPRIFTMLRNACPTILNHAFIVTYFLRGPSITLTSDLTHVKNTTISEIKSMGNTLQELELRDFPKCSDKVFAQLLARLPLLKKLSLRECTKAASLTIQAATKHCPLLTIVNFNFTSVTPLSLVPFLISRGDHLESLKLAGLPNWTDATFNKLLAGVHALNADFQMPSLHTLKLRQTMLSDVSLHVILATCPNLKRLDVSFTLIRRMPPAGTVCRLEKLMLTSTSVVFEDINVSIDGMPELKSISIGAMSSGRNYLTMGNAELVALTPHLARLEKLESLSLVGNARLDQSSVMRQFIRDAGRRCKILNLASLPGLRSSYLDGLAPMGPDDTPSPLEILDLSNSAVDDDAVPYISSCPSLRILNIGSTGFTKEGIFQILDACPMIEQLNLTSCRGVRVTERRQFFEVWANERENA
ncbi:hypothetical protein PLICRDRAFT_171104 [Plicaturopsis crispa FD-325 SS-3]|nr:hypothetical protein PLICRDRAFT_171104 [Plicaturopsis crispa FD-325 SS-3]